MTEIVEKQVKASLQSLIKEVKRMASSSKDVSGVAHSFKEVSTEITHLVSETKKLNSLTREGYNSKGNYIREIFGLGDDGTVQLIDRSVKTMGEYQRMQIGIAENAKQQVAASKELAKAEKEQQAAAKAAHASRQRDMEVFAAELQEQDQMTKRLTAALVK